MDVGVLRALALVPFADRHVEHAVAPNASLEPKSGSSTRLLGHEDGLLHHAVEHGAVEGRAAGASAESSSCSPP